jgi:hypothetical protein
LEISKVSPDGTEGMCLVLVENEDHRTFIRFAHELGGKKWSCHDELINILYKQNKSVLSVCHYKATIISPVTPHRSPEAMDASRRIARNKLRYKRASRSCKSLKIVSTRFVTHQRRFSVDDFSQEHQWCFSFLLSV